MNKDNHNAGDRSFATAMWATSLYLLSSITLVGAGFYSDLTDRSYDAQRLVLGSFMAWAFLHFAQFPTALVAAIRLRTQRALLLLLLPIPLSWASIGLYSLLFSR